MKLIGLFFPAIISLKVSIQRDHTNKRNVVELLMKFGLYVLLDNWFTQVIITYVLNTPDVTIDAFNSFPFFTKYIAISGAVALVFPLCIELMQKYVKISVETGIDCSTGKSDEKNN